MTDERRVRRGSELVCAYCMAWKANVFRVLARSVLHSNSAHDTLKREQIPPLHKPFVSVSNDMRILRDNCVPQLV